MGMFLLPSRLWTERIGMHVLQFARTNGNQISEQSEGIRNGVRVAQKVSVAAGAMIDTIIGLTIGVVIYTLGVKFLVGIWPWEFDKLRGK
jgi:hypothetical protein